MPLSRRGSLVFGFVRQELGTNAHRAGSNLGLPEEDGEAQADGDHRCNEEQRDGRAEMGSREVCSEKQHDDEADEHGRKHGQEDRTADEVDATVEHAKLGGDPVMLFPAAGEEPRFKHPATVDDSREPRGADVEEGADAREQEDRRDRQLDDLGDGRDRCGRIWEHRARMPR